MRGLFYRLNKSGIKVDISTFSKACKERGHELFHRIYTEIKERLRQSKPAEARMLTPIDSTVITLTSKLFWIKNYHQVKLLNGINLTQGNTTDCLISFGQAHDAKFTNLIPDMIPENSIGIMDRGFASWKFLDDMAQKNVLFVVRIKNNMKTVLDHNRYRVVCFYDEESQTEYRLATNVHDMSDEEIIQIYKYRWEI